MPKTDENELQRIHHCSCPVCRREPDGVIARQHQAINRVVARADERNRRLIVGFLAQQHGRGGIALLTRVTGLDRNPVARGRREFSNGDTTPVGRVRRPGGGRKRMEARSPES